MGRVESSFKWCLEKGGEGPKHRGLKEIDKSPEESQKQLRKAESDLDTMQYLWEGGKTDWVASTAFYAMYHSLLAVLYQMGYESRNQECTFVTIEKLIADGAIKLEQEWVNRIRSLQEGENAKTIREELQYGSKTSMEEERCKRLMNSAREFVDRIKETIQKIS